MALRHFSVMLAMCLILSACNLPNIIIQEDNLQETASALQEQQLALVRTQAVLNFLSGETATALAQPTATPSASSTPTETPIPVLVTSTSGSPALTGPVVSVSGNTHCRTGPGKNFVSRFVFKVGERAAVVAKNSKLEYWVIQSPTSSTLCWLWDYYATVEGNTANIPEATSPPTPTELPTLTPSHTPTATKTHKPTRTSTATP
jgi:hypothetical protein